MSLPLQTAARNAASDIVEDVGHELLALTGQLPISGLQECAKLLKDIWDGVALAKINRRECERVAAVCEDKVIVYRAAVAKGGVRVQMELKPYLTKLVSALRGVREVMRSQARRSLFVAYLRRNKVSRELNRCELAVAASMMDFQGLVVIHSVCQNDRVLERLERVEERIGGGQIHGGQCTVLARRARRASL